MRGYFPLENILATDVFGPYDAWILAPSFFEGGRVTFGDVHYALDAHDQKTLIPVGDTPSAQDKSFGFRSSNMRDWISEKLGTATTSHGVEEQAPTIVTISVDVLRRVDADEAVAEILRSTQGQPHIKDVPPIIVPNTFGADDMAAFVAGCDLVSNMKFLYRTGASFVSTRLNIRKRAPVNTNELFHSSSQSSKSHVGGLIVIGSYVPRTTAQREYLLEHCQGHIQHLELDVEGLLKASDENRGLIQKTAEAIDEALQKGLDAVVSTSRRLITSEDAEESLRMGSIVNNVLVSITREVKVRPKYVIAKVSKRN